MPPAKKDLCSHSNVSAWLYHSSVEINSLLQFQFSLNEKLSLQCKSNLTSHMCSFGLQCFADFSIYTTNYLQNVRRSCGKKDKLENENVHGCLVIGENVQKFNWKIYFVLFGGIY